MARHFDSDTNNQRSVIWDTLFPYILDEQRPLDDRIVAAKELVRTTEDERSDFYHEDVLDVLFAMVDDQNLNKLQKLKIGGVLARAGFELGDLPEVRSLIEDGDVSITERLRTLKGFVLHREDRDAEEQLLQLTKLPYLSYRHVIDALPYFNNSTEFVATLIDDPTAPPEWRLKAAIHIDRHQSDDKPAALLTLICDEAISIRVRLLAFDDLPKAFSHERRGELLAKMATQQCLSNSERLSIVEVAIKIQARDLARRLLDDAVMDTPHSIAEIADIAEGLYALGETQEAAALLGRLTTLPEIVLEEIVDHWTTVEAAKLMARVGNGVLAVEFLKRVLVLADWSTRDQVLDGIEEIADEDESRSAASYIISDLLSVMEEQPKGYVGNALYFYKECLAKNRIRELEPIWAVAKDATKAVSVRAEEERMIADLQGEERLEEALTKRAFDGMEEPSDNLLEMRELVSNFGDKRALQIIISAGSDLNADTNGRLDAIEALDELGYRALSRSLMDEVKDRSDADDWWVGDLLLRFGRKADALKYFERSIVTCPESHRDQIARSLAELQAVEALEMLRSRHVAGGIERQQASVD